MVQVFGYALTKHDGGHLRGILTLGGPAWPIDIAAMMTMKSAANSPYTWGLLIVSFRNLARLAAVLRPAKSALKDYISPTFVHLALGPL